MNRFGRIVATAAIGLATAAAAVAQGVPAHAATGPSHGPSGTSAAAGWSQVTSYCRTTADGTACLAIDRDGSSFRGRFALSPAAGHFLKPISYNRLQLGAGGPDMPFCQSGCSALRGSWVTTKPMEGYSVEKFVYNTPSATEVLYVGSTGTTPPLTACKNTAAGSICAGGRASLVTANGNGYLRWTSTVAVHPTGGKWIAPEAVRVYAGDTTYTSGTFCSGGCVRHTSAWAASATPFLILLKNSPQMSIQTAFKVSAYGVETTVVSG